MKHWLLLSLWLPLCALDLSIQSGKEDKKPYSILHLSDVNDFACLPMHNDDNEIIRIECDIPKATTARFSTIHNAHFTVEHKVSALSYKIFITPKTKIALYADSFDLRKVPEMYVSSLKPTKRWSVIGYTDSIPMIGSGKTNPNALNLPIHSAKEIYPYVGGLDLKGNPIIMNRIQDVNGYMEVKKAYSNEEYTKTLSLAKETADKYPNTIFKNELLLYQIRALHFVDNNEQLIPLAKQFIRQYSGDQAIAEVLAYTGNAYSKIGQIGESDYFYKRLFSEYSETDFAMKGMFLKAQQLEVTGNPKPAAKFYGQVLEKTKDVDLASSSAFRLANIETGLGRLENAKKYIDQIAHANPDYFTKVKEESLNLINTYTEKKDSNTAAKITLCLLDKSLPKSDEHQALLKNLGLLYATAGEKEKALIRFDKYLKLYPNAAGAVEIKHAKDGLFFETSEPKGSEGLKKYNDLIDQYGNDTVGEKALYKKAQLLLKEKKFQDVLDIESDLYRLNTKDFPEVNTIISKSAIELTKQKLKVLKCTEAMTLHKMYRIKLLPQWDGLTFNCTLRMGNFPVAKKIATPHLKATTIAERQLWLSRVAKMNFQLGEYKEAIRAGDEAVTLLEAQKNPALNEVYRTLFDAAERLGDDLKMIEYIKGCENSFGTSFTDIERYTKMVSVGLKRKDEVIVQNYANRVVTLQNRTKTYTQSPFIEFTLAQSLINQDKNNDASQVLKTLNARDLTAEKRARQQYLIGSLAMKLGKKAEAKTSFSASIKADAKSAWGRLAKDALGLL